MYCGFIWDLCEMHAGFILDALWVYFRRTWDAWGCIWDASGMYVMTCFGCTRAVFGLHMGCIWAVFRVHLGCLAAAFARVLGSHLVYIGCVCGVWSACIRADWRCSPDAFVVAFYNVWGAHWGCNLAASVMCWVHLGYIWDVFVVVLSVVWGMYPRCIGAVLGNLGVCLGCIWVVFGMSFRCIWDVLGLYVGWIWDALGAHLRLCLGCVRDVFGMHLGVFGDGGGFVWDAFGRHLLLISGCFWDVFRVYLG